MSFKYESCIEKKEANVLKDISVNQLLEFRPGCRRLDVEKRLKTYLKYLVYVVVHHVATRNYGYGSFNK